MTLSSSPNLAATTASVVGKLPHGPAPYAARRWYCGGLAPLDRGYRWLGACKVDSGAPGVRGVLALSALDGAQQARAPGPTAILT